MPWCARPIASRCHHRHGSRVTRALRFRNREQALATASGLVSDGMAARASATLQAFLAVPRFRAARGAVVLILRRAGARRPQAMTDAVKRLAARAWHLSWMSPLAAEPGYRPETAALQSILPHLDALADAGSTERLCHHVLNLAQPRAAQSLPLPAEGRGEGILN
jgi:uncharacterized protein with von Willebrand factor type A (vWA) domain